MFSWGKGSTTTTYPVQRTAANVTGSPAFQPPPRVATAINLGFSRQQHLQSLLNDSKLAPSTRKASNDDTTYDIVFCTKSGEALLLRIHLSTREGVAPVMSLLGVEASHPWLDSNMRVIGFPPIANDANWRTSKMKLGKAVADVVEHLQLNPPVILKITDPVIQKLQARQSHSRNNSLTPLDQPFQLDLPPIPSSFIENQTMSKEEIQILLQDEKAFKLYMARQPALNFMVEKQAAQIQKNIKQAEANLTKENELRSLHSELANYQTQLKQKITEYETLQGTYNMLCAPEDKQQVISKLHLAKRQAFTETEKLATTWLDHGDMTVNDFIRGFMKDRVVFHTRAAKLERLMSDASP